MNESKYLKPDKAGQMQRLYEKFKMSDRYESRLKQRSFCKVARNVLQYMIDNHKFDPDTISGLIHLFAVNPSKAFIDEYLRKIANTPKDFDELYNLFEQCSSHGFTAVGKTKISITKKNVQKVEAFLASIFQANSADEIKTIVTEFMQLNIPYCTAGIYSPWLHYIHPALCPISNKQIKKYLSFIGVSQNKKMDYPFMMDLLSELKEVIGAEDYSILDQFICYTDFSNIDLALEEPHVWLWAPGNRASAWEMFYNANEMGLGWDYLGDYRNYNDDKELIAVIKEKEPEVYKKSNPTQSVNMINQFTYDMRVGDIVIAKNGLYELVGWGIVKSGYNYDSNIDKYKSRRKVQWMDNQKKSAGMKEGNNRILPQKTLTDITQYSDMVDDLKRILNIKTNIMAHSNDPIIEEALALLDNSRQIILQGAPGVGKTYITSRLALAICGEVADSQESIKQKYAELVRNKRVTFVTFHQSLDYEEFVEGMKPDSNSDNMKFVVKPGIFKQISNRALFSTIKLEEKQVSSLDFNDCYEALIKKIKTGEIQEFPLKTPGMSMVVTQVSDKNNIKLSKDANGSRSYTVSYERLYHLYERFNTQEKFSSVSSMVESIRSTIGGCNTSAYWAVLNYILNQLNIGDTSDDLDMVERDIDDKGQSILIKDFLDKASVERNSQPGQKYVLIIDEINRANISKVLGELITLLEKSKRIGNEDEFTVTLPYSNEKFGVPDNLYIIATMNTADRSLGTLDYAIRRRFSFMTLESRREVVEESYKNKSQDLCILALDLYDKVEKIIKDYKSEYFDFSDIMVGHSYFMADSKKQLATRLNAEIKPLLKEYEKDGILVNVEKEVISNLSLSDKEEDGK